MKKFFLFTFSIGTMLSCSSCQAIEGIFKAGVWVGVLAVIVVVALIVFLVSRARK